MFWRTKQMARQTRGRGSSGGRVTKTQHIFRLPPNKLSEYTGSHLPIIGTTSHILIKTK